MLGGSPLPFGQPLEDRGDPLGVWVGEVALHEWVVAALPCCDALELLLEFGHAFRLLCQHTCTPERVRLYLGSANPTSLDWSYDQGAGCPTQNGV